MIHRLQNRWFTLWSRLSVREIPSFDEVRTRYEERHRSYHTLTHIHECLEWYDRQRQPDGILEVAIWLHDLIYDPRAHDNEEQSVILADQWLNTCLAPQQIKRVTRLILATKHTAPPVLADEARLVDIDLAILGAPQERFWQFEEQIRKEYAWVETPHYRATRATLMQNFLNRPHIYHSSFIRTHLEEQARFKLQRLIEKLTGLNKCQNY